MDNLLEIITKPDNIPIIGMLFAIIICLIIGFKQAFENDKLIKEDKRDDMYDKMID